ncbi:unnamed protein product [Prorocentrum cordatum]|uniref:Uncharacterized protein n=1 Tax=Prorocentrum cordatum TaxID=2364126 RepID=A0ABN9QN43_9DINO|nr:unnamed protein product [Polarella glacialis]
MQATQRTRCQSPATSAWSTSTCALGFGYLGFFQQTSHFVLAHRLCDLRLRDFLLDYPARGQEAGLCLSFLDPACWMYFYAHAVPTAEQWEQAVQSGEAPAQVGGSAGHVSGEVQVEDGDEALARGRFAEFAALDGGLTPGRLARCLAYFRHRMEVSLVKGHTWKVDQRDFDGMVLAAATPAFEGLLRRRAAAGAEAAAAARDLVCRVCRERALGLQRDFEVEVLWLRPAEFIGEQTCWTKTWRSRWRSSSAWPAPTWRPAAARRLGSPPPRPSPSPRC